MSETPQQYDQQQSLAPDATGPIPVAVAASALNVAQYDPRPPEIDLDAREGSGIDLGADTRLSWAARTDVGLVRGHNEDSFLARNPLFGVCDGMGGHAAGEVASSIAVRTIAEQAPTSADDALLGAAVEAANEAVMNGAATGVGKPGMGCTASCCLIEGTHMAVAHVGDSRIYLLHQGTLVRITHDHSYVEELVDAGEITADEARVHPNRSIITRALGSDPDMYADHFLLDVQKGDRIILCSDGLSSMVPDSTIEALAVSSATPLDCTDALVAAALGEGGHDNVSVITVDILSDGTEEARRRARRHTIIVWATILGGILAAAAVAFALIVNNSWYVSVYAGKVAIYRGVRGSLFGHQLSHLDEETTVDLSSLPESTQHLLSQGIAVSSKEAAESTVEAYKTQISEEQSKAETTAANAQSESEDGTVGDIYGTAGPDATSSTAAQSKDTKTDSAEDTTKSNASKDSSAEGGE